MASWKRSGANQMHERISVPSDEHRPSLLPMFGVWPEVAACIGVCLVTIAGALWHVAFDVQSIAFWPGPIGAIGTVSLLAGVTILSLIANAVLLSRETRVATGIIDRYPESVVDRARATGFAGGLIAIEELSGDRATHCVADSSTSRFAALLVPGDTPDRRQRFRSKLTLQRSARTEEVLADGKALADISLLANETPVVEIRPLGPLPVRMGKTILRSRYTKSIVAPLSIRAVALISIRMIAGDRNVRSFTVHARSRSARAFYSTQQLVAGPDNPDRATDEIMRRVDRAISRRLETLIVSIEDNRGVRAAVSMRRYPFSTRCTVTSDDDFALAHNWKLFQRSITKRRPLHQLSELGVAAVTGAAASMLVAILLR